jgi:predicted amidohydrolase YtcJ
MWRTICLAAVLIAGFGGGGGVARAQPPATADLLVVNGQLVTMNARQPSAEALAVVGDRISWVGTSAEARRRYPGAAQVVDLQGAAVIPGIIDAHTHLQSLGESLLRLNLKDLPSESAVVERVKKAAARTPRGAWIVGWGWDEGKWAGRYPTNAALSRATPDHPVFLVGLHGFAAWANRKALALAGISRSTPDPENGQILRDRRSGQAIGILTNQAQQLVSRHIPALTAAETERAVELAAAECARHGLTSVHEAKVSGPMLAAYRQLLAAGRLPLRIFVMLDGADRALIDKWLARGPEIDPRHRLTVRSIKLFADGALGSRGAALLEPYSDQPDSRGLFTNSGEAVHDLTRRAVTRGFQVATHAIGDAANRSVLDAYERVLRETQAKDARLRIEHAQVLGPADVPRFARLGVIASMQPTHATSDMAWAEKRVGPTRIQGAYAWQSILATGAHLPLSSDFPGESVDPFHGLYAALTRQSPDGTPAGGWFPAQRLTLEQALRGYTLEAAYAEWEEKDKGSLEPGKLADFLVLSHDLRKLSGQQLLTVRVKRTFLGGKLVFQSQS